MSLPYHSRLLSDHPIKVNVAGWPDSQEPGLFSWSRALGLFLQAVDVVDGQNGGSHKPGQTQEGTDDDQGRHNEQVQVVTSPFLWMENAHWLQSPFYMVSTKYTGMTLYTCGIVTNPILNCDTQVVTQSCCVVSVYPHKLRPVFTGYLTDFYSCA